MYRQPILAAFEEDKIIGFVFFKENYTNEIISAAELPNIYISTLIVAEEARGKGLTLKMYYHLFVGLYPERSVFTRTWLTNAAHTKILLHFDFTELIRKYEERGKGIDTVYYKKEIKAPVLAR